HPGNILILPEGVIGMLDCGMVGRLDDKMREEVEDMLAAIARRDAAHLTFIVTRVGSIPIELDQAGLSADIADLIAYHGSMPLDQLEVGKALTEVTEIIRRYHILLPTSLA